jgi:putative nucleotidyltransferase with HDIG domain
VPVIYRVRQFIGAATAWGRSETANELLAEQYLNFEAFRLFESMPRYDRKHASNVLRTLLERGYTDRDLLAASLLHDVGKTASQRGGLRLWHRVAVVMMRAARPSLVERVGQDRPGSWRYPFFVQQHHATIGAELARQACCSQRVVALIQHHEEVGAAMDDPMLAALQSADNLN